MSTRMPRLLLLAVAALLPLLAMPPSAAQGSAADRGAIDRWMSTRLDAANLPGAALAITHDGRLLHVQGYGQAADGRPMTPQTQFRIGSLSKSFTATAVLELVDAGQVSLDDPVRTYLPEFGVDDPRGDRITVRHLLNQTSGLADTGFPAARLSQPTTLAEQVASLHAARLVDEPGTRFHYFDPNYAVLARLVEVVSGDPFPEYLRRNVLAPLGMNDTVTTSTAGMAARVAPRLAQGYILVYGIPVARAEMEGFLGGSGGVVSTADDLARWLIAQGDASTVMHTAPAGIDSDYAMGWTVSDSPEGPRRLEHTGVLSTFYAEQVLLPDSGYGIVVLFNSYNALTDYHGIVEGLIALVAGRQPPTGGWSGEMSALLLAALTLLTIVLRARRFARAPVWASRTRSTRLWRLLPGFAWLLIPAVLLAYLPRIVSVFSGRVFTHRQLFRAMPSVTLWLAVAAVTGLALGITRVAALARRGTP